MKTWKLKKNNILRNNKKETRLEAPGPTPARRALTGSGLPMKSEPRTPQLGPQISSLETCNIDQSLAERRRQFTKFIGLGSGVPIPPVIVLSSLLLLLLWLLLLLLSLLALLLLLLLLSLVSIGGRRSARDHREFSRGGGEKLPPP